MNRNVAGRYRIFTRAMLFSIRTRYEPERGSVTSKLAVVIPRRTTLPCKSIIAKGNPGFAPEICRLRPIVCRENCGRCQTLTPVVPSLELDLASLELDTTTLELDFASLELDTTALELDFASLELDTTTLELDFASLELDTITLELDANALEQDSIALEELPGTTLTLSYFA